MKWFIVILVSVLLAVSMVSRDFYFTVTGNGPSMTPCFTEGGLRKVYPFINPIIGKPVALECKSDKCDHRNLIKILKQKRDNCIWIEGCNDKSFDSRDYGWLCGGEYKFLGLVEELKSIDE